MIEAGKDLKVEIKRLTDDNASLQEANDYQSGTVIPELREQCQLL